MRQRPLQVNCTTVCCCHPAVLFLTTANGQYVYTTRIISHKTYRPTPFLIVICTDRKRKRFKFKVIHPYVISYQYSGGYYYYYYYYYYHAHSFIEV